MKVRRRTVIRPLSRRMRAFRALMAVSAFLLWAAEMVFAQTLTPDMMSPSRGGFAPADQSPLRKSEPVAAPPIVDRTGTSNKPLTRPADDERRREFERLLFPKKEEEAAKPKPAESRVGKNPPLYASPAASAAGITGFDSLNRKRQKRKYYPAEPKPKFVGPGSPLMPPGGFPPPKRPLTTVERAPVPVGVTGGTAIVAAGSPFRRRLKVEDDPFGAPGIYLGPFLTKAAIETSAGYDTNPGRLTEPKGSAFYKVAPELLIASDWSRHSLIADLRGSYTGYASSVVPTNPDGSPLSGFVFVPRDIDRPDFNGKVNGRLDVLRELRVNSEARLRVFTDNPGSPNIQAGLAKYPLATNVGGTFGVERDFNRLQIAGSGLIDRTIYQYSQLNDGTATANDDRNFNQFGGLARASYDLRPGIKPFVEASADNRVHDLAVDRFGYRRDSSGSTVKAGSTFELSRLLTGEFAVGYASRDYEDTRLKRLEGLLTSGSLIWNASGLTTVTISAASSIDETTLPGVSGILTRDYALQVDHAFRRWLIGTVKVGAGTSDYDSFRFDKRYFAEGDLVWKLNRTFQIKAQVRHDWLESSLPNFDSKATVVMLGVRLQR